MRKITRTIKTIKVEADKCNGCFSCEVMCSGFHAVPKYSSTNPARSRIRVFRDPLRDIYIPVRAGAHTMAECSGRNKYVIDGIEYDECTFCQSSCTSRDYFKEPDSGLPLKCDMCEGVAPSSGPVCVETCEPGALIYMEREEEIEEVEEKLDNMQIGLEALIRKYGLRKMVEAVSHLAKKG